jgi:hypothetical protein
MGISSITSNIYTYKTFFHVCNLTPAPIVKGGKGGND